MRHARTLMIAVFITAAAYLSEMIAVIVWLSAETDMARAQTGEETARTIRMLAMASSAGVMFAGAFLTGAFRSFEDAVNTALAAAGMFLALEVSISLAVIAAKHPWDGVAYSFLSKVIAGILGAGLAGGLRTTR